MKTTAEALRDYLRSHPIDTGDDGCETVLEQLYLAYANSHESDPPEILSGFADLETLLESLPLDNNNAVINLTCRLCTHYEHKAFLDGVQYGAALMMELREE